MRSLIVVALALGCAAVACSPGGRNNSGDDTVIDANPGADAAPPVCTDGAHECSGATFQVCSGGQWTTAMDCPVACDGTLGCVQCSPGMNTCGSGDVHSCDGSGNLGPVVTACTGSDVCQGAQCVDACADAGSNRNYIGCDYYAVDLDNALEVVDLSTGPNCALVTGVIDETLKVCTDGAGGVAGTCDPPGNTCPSGFTCTTTSVCVLDAQHAPFAVVVSNPQARAVDVTLTGTTGAPITVSVPAGAVQAIEPNTSPNTLADQSIDGTGIQKAAYHVTSTLPIVAYQFNPLDNVNVFSNDASLLIPTATFDIEYYALSWQTTDNRAQAPGLNDFFGYITVVAWKDNTVVEVTPTAAVQASSTQTTVAAGVPTRFTLNAMQVLNLEASGPGGDLTGSHITSVDGVTTFGVFGGNEAAAFGESNPPDAIHTDGPCCADHLEAMMFPTSTWGKTFAIARSAERTNEPDRLRIMAQKDGTTVTFSPAPELGTCPTLAAGAFCEVRIAVDTEIIATQPILVGQYLESTIWDDGIDSVGTGDPAMSVAVPTEQFRTDYILPIPQAYDENFLSIAGPAGSILVDGVAPTAFSTFGTQTWHGTRVKVAAGQHHLTCPNGCGVMVYGYSEAVSYMFAGGLDLKQIVIN